MVTIAGGKTEPKIGQTCAHLPTTSQSEIQQTEYRI